MTRATTPEPEAGIASTLPRKMLMSWSTDAGQVEFSFPSDLSEQDIADVEALIAVTLRGARRRASTGQHLARAQGED